MLTYECQNAVQTHLSTELHSCMLIYQGLVHSRIMKAFQGSITFCLNQQKWLPFVARKWIFHLKLLYPYFNWIKIFAHLFCHAIFLKCIFCVSNVKSEFISGVIYLLTMVKKINAYIFVYTDIFEQF